MVIPYVLVKLHHIDMNKNVDLTILFIQSNISDTFFLTSEIKQGILKPNLDIHSWSGLNKTHSNSRVYVWGICYNFHNHPSIWVSGYDFDSVL